MATQAQITANRINAQFSTGAKTEEGKAKSSRNNLRFGFTGRFFVAECEDQDQFDQLVSDLEDEHRPSTPTEKILVRNMAQHHWLAQRAIYMQDCCIDETGVCFHEKQMALMIRYQTTHQRAFHKCLKELLTLRAQKHKEEIGFESQKEKQRDKNAADYHTAKAEARRDELHQAKMQLLISQTTHQELKNQALRAPAAGSQCPDSRLGVASEPRL